MKKQLRFLYRYYITSRRWRRLVNRQTMIVLVAAAAFITTLAFTSPSAADREIPRAPQQYGKDHAAVLYISGIFSQSTPAPDAQPTPESEVIRVSPTNTPFPPEFFENADQTVGITLAGALLVVIVVLGVLTLMPRKR